MHLLISLWITSSAFAWGELGHRIVAASGTALADPVDFANCHVSAAEIVDHTNDPDKVWRQQKRQHPDEALMHFFHVDRQPKDWRDRKTAQDPTQGQLVYRIVSWIEDAKKLRQSKDWNALSQEIYGLSHYIGDLSQPLHLFHDYDGVEAGIPDVHSQFETKMLNRYEEPIRAGVSSRLAQEKIPLYWKAIDMKSIIFDTAEQSAAKAPKLLQAAKPALEMPKPSRRRKSNKKSQEPRFVKKILWQQTGSLAIDQLAIGARLWAHVLNTICK
jgi:hypothetical protein